MRRGAGVAQTPPALKAALEASLEAALAESAIGDAIGDAFGEGALEAARSRPCGPPALGCHPLSSELLLGSAARAGRRKGVGLASGLRGRASGPIPLRMASATAHDPSPDELGGSDRGFFVFNAIVSVVALSILAWLLLLRDGGDAGELDLSFMPAVNASLNGAAAIMLTAGWIAIRKKRIGLHKRLMVASFVASTFFLVGYLAYHYVHGDTKYEGEWGAIYFPLLISHVLLSIPIVPMALSAFYFAWKKRFATHRKVTRILAPIWVYVSITGVAVYFFLR